MLFLLVSSQGGDLTAVSARMWWMVPRVEYWPLPGSAFVADC